MKGTSSSSSAVRRVVIGTAGHVDHGKTALVRALTGIDTDRLAEEKRRGITLELGFAHLPLPGGTTAGVVDVPGHERFVRAMAAGAGGFDVALLVVAADEGVMPQTREHVAICRLLGIQSGVVAVTKSDLLPALGPAHRSLLAADVEALVAGTFLEDAPIVEVSSMTGGGLDALREALAAAASRAAPRPEGGPACLPIDRAFTLKGFGTVVTGTLISGTLEAGEAVELLPGGPRGARVRGLQTHGRDRISAAAGQRTAVNLPGVQVEQLSRGMVLGRPGELIESTQLDVEVEAVAGVTFSAREKLLCHVGTTAVPATVVLLAGRDLPAGERGFAQLRLARPLVALPGQRFVLRGFSARPGGAGRTLGGGIVLAPATRKRRPGRPESAAGLAVLLGGEPAEKIAWLLEDAGSEGLDAADLFRRTALPVRTLERALEALGAAGKAVLFDRERRAHVGGATFAALRTRAEGLVRAYHVENPLAPGMPKEELRERLARALDARLLARVLAAEAAAGQLVTEGDAVRAPEHGTAGAGGGAREQILARLAASALSPPTTAELARAIGLPLARTLELLKLLAGERRILKVKDDLYFDAAALGALRDRLIGKLRAEGAITTQEFKEMTGATRKFSIPLGEYFDREKLTLRLGDKRVLRGAEPRPAGGGGT